MPSTALIISRLKKDYPQFLFKESARFSWSPTDKTIYYLDKNSNNDYYYLFHELSHALLAHANYNYDVELIAMECRAWDTAMDLADKYNLKIEETAIQSTLDTYRDWLHERSTCPECKATGVQTGKYTYKCLACNYRWRVNEARICALRRYRIKT